MGVSGDTSRPAMRCEEVEPNHDMSMYRVKLYKLSAQGQWDDKGTGHVGVEYLPNVQKAGAPGLVLVAESNCKVLLVHKICKADTYNRQGEDTIITWMDADIGADVALSFQEENGCAFIWNRIQDISKEKFGVSPGATPTTVPPDGTSPTPDPEPPSVAAPSPLDPSRHGPMCIKLPWPDVRTLPEIGKALNEVPMTQRERVALYIHQEGTYLPRLLTLFRQCEEVDNTDALTHLYTIVKSLIMMNDMQLVDEMMSENNFWDVVGCLEYDPDLAPKKSDHRNFLRNVAKFQEVVDIPDPTIKAKIHTTFRLGYIKDAVLPRALDDLTFAALHSMMMFNYMDILQSLAAAPYYFKTLFQKLRECDRDSQQYLLLMTFLQEVCHYTSHPQFQARNDITTLFMKEGLLDITARALSSTLPAVKTKAMEILLTVVQSDVAAVRQRMLGKPYTILNQVISLLLGRDENGLPEQALEALKLLLDPESMDLTGHKNEFLELFYDQFMDRVVLVISAAGRQCVAEATAASVAAVAAAGGAVPTTTPPTLESEAPDAVPEAAPTLPSPVVQVGEQPNAAPQATLASPGELEADVAPTGATPASELTPPPGSATTAGAREQPRQLLSDMSLRASETPGTAAAAQPQPQLPLLSTPVGTQTPEGSPVLLTVPSPSPPDAGMNAAGSPSATSDAQGLVSPSIAPDAPLLARLTATRYATDPPDILAPPPFVMGLILELLQYCVTHHSFRIKYFILRHNIIQKVLRLVHSPKKWLAVAAIRFLRTCVGLKDEFYNRYLARNDLFKQPLLLFLHNGEKSNLLNSTFLELMEFVRTQGDKQLVVHFVEQYWEQVKHITYVATFQMLKDKYENLRNSEFRVSEGPAGTSGDGLRRCPRELDQEEEAYFAEGSDDDDDAMDSHASPSLLPSTSGPRPRAHVTSALRPGHSTLTDTADVPSPFTEAGSGTRGSPNLAAAFTRRAYGQSDSGVQWPGSGPISAFAGSSLVDYPDDDDDDDLPPASTSAPSPPHHHPPTAADSSLTMFQRAPAPGAVPAAGARSVVQWFPSQIRKAATPSSSAADAGDGPTLPPEETPSPRPVVADQLESNVQPPVASTAAVSMYMAGVCENDVPPCAVVRECSSDGSAGAPEDGEGAAASAQGAMSSHEKCGDGADAEGTLPQSAKHCSGEGGGLEGSKGPVLPLNVGVAAGAAPPGVAGETPLEQQGSECSRASSADGIAEGPVTPSGMKRLSESEMHDASPAKAAKVEDSTHTSEDSTHTSSPAP